MTTIQLQCFITSAQTLNFTKTSQLLYISQPTVTHHILNLEAELGFQLFTRNKKQIMLTAAGESFYKSMTKISFEFNEAVLCARKCDEESKNHICIGCGSSEFEMEFLPVIIRKFNEKYPDIYVTYNSENIRDKVKLFHQHKIDILFSTTQMVKDFSTIEYYDLKKYPIVCVVNKENPLANKEIITIHDLSDQNLIFLEPTISPPEMETLQQQLILKYPNKVSHFICDTAVTHLMILSNMGIAIMPEFKYKKDDKLVIIPYNDYPPVSYGIAKQSGDTREFVNSFIRITQEVFIH
jgi:DNA-binding transcriptional LysR family regulator